MTEKMGSEPAFPTGPDGDEKSYGGKFGGLTIRQVAAEVAALMAMNGALRAIVDEQRRMIEDISGFAEDCIKIADAVLAEEAKTRK